MSDPAARSTETTSPANPTKRARPATAGSTMSGPSGPASIGNQMSTRSSREPSDSTAVATMGTASAAAQRRDEGRPSGNSSNTTVSEPMASGAETLDTSHA